MSLLIDLTTHAVDEAYQQAARRKTASSDVVPAPAARRSRRATAVLVGVVLAAAGALFATSAVATHRNADAAKRDRKELVKQINEQTAQSDRLQRQLDELRAKVASARDAALSASGRGSALQREIAELEMVAGTQAVEGSGVQVTLDNAKDISNPDTASLGTIYDRDIQAVVDALFASGAEAIAVNGERLTARTAIREAGDAILVDYRPLAPPYHIDAIGPPDLKATFLKTQTGTLYENWRQVYGLGFSVDTRQRLTLPSAAEPVVRYAEPVVVPPSAQPLESP
ncbi:MAG TPA: DUF881 domain-containing protein [Acidothermaceae bacterium]|jgi:uncharacterized protein YlxW (UPF0749 family)